MRWKNRKRSRRKGEYYSNSDTHSTYWYFITQLFLNLPVLSPDSIITNLHIFPFLSYFFFIVDGWCLSTPADIFCYFREIKMFVNIVRSGVFLQLGKPQDIWHSEPNLLGHQDGAIRTHKTVTLPGKSGWIGSVHVCVCVCVCVCEHRHVYRSNFSNIYLFLCIPACGGRQEDR